MTEQEPLPEEEYRDMIDLQVTENATIRLESDLLHAELSTYRHSLECGVKVTQDGGNIAICSGTVNQSELPHLYAWCGLTPEQARSLAGALEEAADNAEEDLEGSAEPKQDTQTFLRRLMP